MPATSPAPLLLDVSRLLWRAQRTGPSGIDRIELAYALHFLCTDPPSRPAYAVIHVWGRLIGINSRCARRFFEALAARWEGTPGARQPQPARGLWWLYGLLIQGHWMLGFQLRRRLRSHASSPVFLVLGHYHLAAEARILRIQRDYGARCAGFLHDLIPIDYPEYCKPGKDLWHRQVTQTMTRHFATVIVNSEATAASYRAFLATELPPGRRTPAVQVALPGIRPFPGMPPAVHLPAADSVPYFVVIGTIEPKKNHLLLLNLWTRLASTLSQPPRLYVIGSRGWENEQVVDMLERSHRLQGLVEERNHDSDSAVGALLAGARALLMPSLVEGFGLPVAEALASGIPVICSDIGAFREVGQGVPDYLDPLDLPAWQAAVIDYCAPGSARRAAQLLRLGAWRAPGWDAHFQIIETLVL